MMLFFHEAKTSGLVDLICAWKGVSIVPGETAKKITLQPAIRLCFLLMCIKKPGLNGIKLIKKIKVLFRK
jgi:hypothetical protein